MNEKTIIYAKLVTGDDILAEVKTENINEIVVSNPLQLHALNDDYGVSLRVTRWAVYANSHEFTISKSKMLVIDIPKDSMIEYYLDCVVKIQENTEEIEEQDEEDFDQLETLMRHTPKVMH